MNGWTLNLITGAYREITDEEQAGMDLMTATFKELYGDCDCCCEFVEPYGWVPEAGCPVHDPWNE